MGIMQAVALLAEINLRPFGRFCAEQISLRGELMRDEEIGGNRIGGVPAVGFYLSRTVLIDLF